MKMKLNLKNISFKTAILECWYSDRVIKVRVPIKGYTIEEHFTWSWDYALFPKERDKKIIHDYQVAD